MSPRNDSNQQPASRALVTATVLFYLFAALAMVMANKWVLNTTSAPLFFLLTQLFIAVILFVITNALGLINIPVKLDLQTMRGLIPMVGLNVIGLSFSNYTLKYVDASFYQVARGLVLPFTVLTSFVLLHARPSLLILSSCLFVTIGFFVGVTTSPSLLGITFGVLSSLTTALHAVVIKRSLGLEGIGGDALKLSWYTNAMSVAVLAPCIVLTGEVPSILKLFSGHSEYIPGGDEMSALKTFLWGSIITGSLGFLMSIASLLSIKVTSPITHMISSAVRGVAASLLGVWLFGDIISFGRGMSIATILGGSIFYTWIKHLESSPTKEKYERVPLEDVEASAANGNQRDGVKSEK